MTPAWMDRALCAGSTHPEDWFPEHTPENRHNQRARDICTACPVKAECLEYARQINAGYGIWGGLRIGKKGRRT